MRSPSVLAYHYPLYRDMLLEIGVGKAAYLGAFEGDRMVGALPGFLKETELGTCYSSLPYFGPNAGVVVDETDTSANELRRKLLGSALSLLQDQPHALTASFYSPFLSESWDSYRQALGDAIEVDKQTQYLNLDRLTGFDASVTYDIRKAQKAGVSVSTDLTDDKVSASYQIYAENCREFAIPQKPWAAVRKLAQEGCANGLARVYFAHHQSEIVGALLVLWSKQTSSYYLPCTRTSARALQSSTLLIAQAIGEARAAGLKYWNWESSPPDQAGVFNFKKKWGSLVSPYKIFVKRFCEESELQQIGRARLDRSFPYFFVYPHSQLVA